LRKGSSRGVCRPAPPGRGWLAVAAVALAGRRCTAGIGFPAGAGHEGGPRRGQRKGQVRPRAERAGRVGGRGPRLCGDARRVLAPNQAVEVRVVVTSVTVDVHHLRVTVRGDDAGRLQGRAIVVPVRLRPEKIVPSARLERERRGRVIRPLPAVETLR